MEEKRKSLTNDTLNCLESSANVILKINHLAQIQPAGFLDTSSYDETSFEYNSDQIPDEVDKGSENAFEENEVVDVESGLKKIFEIFSKNQRGLHSTELQEILQQMGYKLSKDNIKQIKQYERKEKIYLKDFLNLVLYEFFDMDDTEDEVQEAFKQFDLQDTGFINIRDLKSILANLGSRYSDDELNEFVRQCDVDEDGNVNYKEFTAKLFQGNHHYEKCHKKIKDS